MISRVNVNSPNAAYKAMAGNWQMINDLLSGTEGMRNAGARWLPRFPKEGLAAYNARLNQTFLYNGMERTIGALTGKPFSEDIHISAAVTAPVSDYLQDVDFQGGDITTFTREVFRIGLGKGLVHIFTDHPPVEAPITLAQKEENQIRPYLCLLPPERVIGWHYIVENGRQKLSQIRIQESVVQPGSDEWSEDLIPQIRVLDRIVGPNGPVVTYRLYREISNPAVNQQPTWTLVQNGTMTTKDIPITTLYFGEQTGFMQAKPPLLDLAWLNIEHWQSSSDQRHILHVARVPVWVLTGYQPAMDDNGNPKNEITIGPDNLVRLENENAKLTVVEHKGAAISAGRDDLKDIEARMAVLGAELLYRKPSKGEKSATEDAHDQKSEDSDLCAMVKTCEDGLTAAIGFMYAWEGKEAPKGKLVTINTDFGLSAQDAADLQSLLQSRQMGEVSKETFLKELQRRGVLAPSVDITKELEAAKVDGPNQQSAEPTPKTVKNNTQDTGLSTLAPKAGAGA